MHLPLQVTNLSKIKHPPWSRLRIIGEHVRSNLSNSEGPRKESYDLLLVDSKQFIVQTIGNCKSQKAFSCFEALDVIKDDIIHTFLSNINTQSSLGN